MTPGMAVWGNGRRWWDDGYEVVVVVVVVVPRWVTSREW